MDVKDLNELKEVKDIIKVEIYNATNGWNYFKYLVGC